MIRKEDITIGIVSFERPERLRNLIASVSDMPNIIVWDNSEDIVMIEQIKSIESLYPDVKFLYCSDNVGVTRAWNQCIIHSTTDWVLQVADDMLFDSSWLKQLNDILSEKPQLEQIHLNAWNAVVFHKKTIARMGWWDERYRYYPSCEDDDWYLRTVELLGYSPYVGIPEHNKGLPYETRIKHHIEKTKELFDRPDNITYFCNSDWSKYEIIGESTITGKEDDAGSRNVSSHVRSDRLNGLQFHSQKWSFIQDTSGIDESNQLINKDGTIWMRQGYDIDWYPDVRKGYLKKYFGVE